MPSRKQVSQDMRQRVLKRYKNRCAYCGCQITPSTMQIDHLVSLYRIGQEGIVMKKNSITNLMPSCKECNSYKGALDLEGFRKRMNTIMDRVRMSNIFNLVEKYGMVKTKIWDGKFYFEKIEEQRANSRLSQNQIQTKQLSYAEEIKKLFDHARKDKEDFDAEIEKMSPEAREEYHKRIRKNLEYITKRNEINRLIRIAIENGEID